MRCHFNEPQVIYITDNDKRSTHVMIICRQFPVDVKMTEHFVQTDCPAPSWEDLEAVMKSLKVVVQGLVDFVRRFNHRRPEMAPPQNTRYKTSMCRDYTAKGSCPRGASCTFAHSQEELEQ